MLFRLQTPPIVVYRVLLLAGTALLPLAIDRPAAADDSSKTPWWEAETAMKPGGELPLTEKPMVARGEGPEGRRGNRTEKHLSRRRPNARPARDGDATRWKKRPIRSSGSSTTTAI